MKRKILIIGGTGFLGSHLIREFLPDCEVFTTLRASSNTFRIKDILDSVKLIRLDEQSISLAVEQNQFDVIINAAVQYQQKEGAALADLIEANILLPIKALEAGARSGCHCFINSDSFFSRIPDPYPYLVEYRLSKKQLFSWLELYASRMYIANMQIEHMYGPSDSQQKFLPMMAKRIASNTPTIELTPGLQSRDFIHVHDVARAFRYVALQSKLPRFGLHTFQVGTGVAHSIKETLTLAAQTVGSSSALEFGKLEYRENECMESIADIGPLNNLGWSATIPWEHGIKRIVLNYKNEATDD
ncbi:NAD-dependent epimerase/dehydratase family protein [bacterium]|nr:NAD-dependent epimerase/dehydratase family protein [bacterium]